MVDLLSIEVKCNSEDQVRSRANKLFSFAGSGFNKLSSSVDKDGFAIPKRMQKKHDNLFKAQDFNNIQILDSDFDDDQSSEGCTTTMMNEEESPDSCCTGSHNLHILSPGSLNLDPMEIEMEDVEEIIPAPMSRRNGSQSDLQLRLPSVYF